MRCGTRFIRVHQNTVSRLGHIIKKDKEIGLLTKFDGLHSPNGQCIYKERLQKNLADPASLVYQVAFRSISWDMFHFKTVLEELWGIGWSNIYGCQLSHLPEPYSNKAITRPLVAKSLNCAESVEFYLNLLEFCWICGFWETRDGQMDPQTEGPRNPRTDGRTKPLIELLFATKSHKNR